ncbi:heterokaryon incompatibility protein-domain-containing protein [Boeremia exigua]|uniref:heterokaryon incompatibility protein-domain-containing protein n=1 Tax=Boeremia exigua TaxID=749465 RepID=UPI001E8EC014|nr:heterokaryon incompatibility protein-domain-containing protein [Boeremia exigua]KAH6637396.1 heterokaryon incompatibility protein-domain-containing protein [Boeremia exigua]
MSLITRRRPCHVCIIERVFRLSISLDILRKASSSGCLRCQLLCKSVEAFGYRWDRQVQGNADAVFMEIAKKFGVESLVNTSVKWRNSRGTWEKLPVEITVDRDQMPIWPLFAKARTVPSNATDPQSIAYIREQISNCDLHHGDCRESETLEKPLLKPKRLLKIVDGEKEDVRLLLQDTLMDSERYIALSHCWGTPTAGQHRAGEVPQTKQADVPLYMSAGIPVVKLTKTFCDAVHLSRTLGVRYLWIDSFCIIQDDDDEKRLELPKMGDIYGGAYLVVAAASAKNGDGGLYRREPQHMFDLVSSGGETLKATVFEKRHHDIWKKGEQLWEAGDLPLLGRAWALQERLLAKRMVHFTCKELIWECRSSVDCECGDLQNPETSGQFGIGKSLKTEYARIIRHGNSNERLSFWQTVSTQFSLRCITRPSDRPPALSSIAKQIDMPGIFGRYLAGIWEYTLPGGLLWWSTQCGVSPGKPRSHVRDRTSGVPTWSWLSIEGPVDMWGKHVKSLVCTHIPASDESGDTYGISIRDGIGVWGKTAVVRIINILENGASKAAVQFPNGSATTYFDTDTYPFEFDDDDGETPKLLALRFSITGDGRGFVHALVLRQASEENNTFERLGLARCPDRFFDGGLNEYITLI